MQHKYDQVDQVGLCSRAVGVARATCIQLCVMCYVRFVCRMPVEYLTFSLARECTIVSALLWLCL